MMRNESISRDWRWLNIFIICLFGVHIVAVILIDKNNTIFGYKGKTLTSDVSTKIPNSNNTTRTNHNNATSTHTNYTILPKRIYTVAGLEDSGTQFVTSIITSALNLKKGGYREGSSPCPSLYSQCEENADIQVQHISLPWGSTCTEVNNEEKEESGSKNLDDSTKNRHKIVDVILPPQCTRYPQRKRVYETQHEYGDIILSQCNQMTRDLWGFEYYTNDKSDVQPLLYPPRYHLNLITHKEWYDAHGVDQYLILIVRDKTISAAARLREHCTDQKLLEEEERIGTSILIDTINKYILHENDHENENEHIISNYKWNPRSLSASASPLKNGSSNNNVVLVSYESMIKLGAPYVQMLYESLDIESDFVPDIQNENQKYVRKGDKKL